MVALPALPSGSKVSLDISAAAADQAIWRSALEAIEADPGAAVNLPPDAPPSPPLPRVGPFGPWTPPARSRVIQFFSRGN